MRRLGVSGVPFFVFKNGGVSGAQVKRLHASERVCARVMRRRAGGRYRAVLARNDDVMMCDDDDDIVVMFTRACSPYPLCCSALLKTPALNNTITTTVHRRTAAVAMRRRHRYDAGSGQCSSGAPFQLMPRGPMLLRWQLRRAVNFRVSCCFGAGIKAIDTRPSLQSDHSV